MQSLLHAVIQAKPTDPYAYMIEQLSAAQSCSAHWGMGLDGLGRAVAQGISSSLRNLKNVGDAFGPYQQSKKLPQVLPPPGPQTLPKLISF